MRRSVVMMFLSLLYMDISAQNIVKGIVVDSDSENPIQNVLIGLKTTTKTTKTSQNGVFILQNIANGYYVLEIKFSGYETQNFPIQFIGNTIDLGTIQLYKDNFSEEDINTIIITDDELDDDSIAADNISRLLQSSKDIYLRSAAFEFGPSFFRIRGLDSDN